MEAPTIILVALFFVAIIAVIGSVVLMRRSESDPLQARINEYAGREEQVSIDDIEMSMPITDRVFLPIIRRISDFVVRYTPQTTLERTAEMLEQAGVRRLSAAEFWAWRGVATVAMAVIFFIILGGYDLTTPVRLAYTVLATGLGFMLPQMLLSSKITRRKQAIMKKLPDALDLMTICVDAGLTFDGAMSKVNEKWDDPLANDFGRVIYEMQLGKSRRQALRDMSDRMDVADVTSFIASVLQADQLGVSVGRVLRIQSEQMRLRRRQRAEEKAQQASLKMLFPLIFLIFPSMFVVLLGPAIFRVVRSSALRSITG